MPSYVTCLNCGRRTRSSSGYCTSNPACLRKNDTLRRADKAVKATWERCPACGTPTNSATGYCSRTSECRKLRYAVIRLWAMEAYGGARCVCCGETRFERLSIDHVFGDGANSTKRAAKGGGSGVLIQALWKAGFPDKIRYQVLCHSCNMEKGVKAVCPCKDGTTIIDTLRLHGII